MICFLSCIIDVVKESVNDFFEEILVNFDYLFVEVIYIVELGYFEWFC